MNADAIESNPRVEIFASGMNGALQRLPKVRCVSLPVLVPEVSLMPWRPSWPRVKTISLTFPAGLEFLPPKRSDFEPGCMSHTAWLGTRAQRPQTGSPPVVSERA